MTFYVNTRVVNSCPTIVWVVAATQFVILIVLSNANITEVFRLLFLYILFIVLKVKMLVSFNAFDL